jgi:hypothetical protein
MATMTENMIASAEAPAPALSAAEKAEQLRQQAAAASAKLREQMAVKAAERAAALARKAAEADEKARAKAEEKAVKDIEKAKAKAEKDAADAIAKAAKTAERELQRAQKAAEDATKPRNPVGRPRKDGTPAGSARSVTSEQAADLQATLSKELPATPAEEEVAMEPEARIAQLSAALEASKARNAAMETQLTAALQLLAGIRKLVSI